MTGRENLSEALQWLGGIVKKFVRNPAGVRQSGMKGQFEDRLTKGKFVIRVGDPTSKDRGELLGIQRFNQWEGTA